MTMEDKSPGGTGSALGEQLGPWPFFLYSCAKMWYLKRLPGSLGLAQVRSRESFLHWPSHSNPTVISVNNGWTEQQAPGQLLLQTIFFKLFSFNTVKLGRNRFSVTTLLTRNIKFLLIQTATSVRTTYSQFTFPVALIPFLALLHDFHGTRQVP